MNPTEPELLTLDEVAKLLKVNRKTLINWRARSLGPRGFRVGRGVRYHRDHVLEWLRRQEAATPGGGPS